MRAGVFVLLLLSSGAALAAPTVADGVGAFERGEYKRARDVLADIVAANAAPADKAPIARLYLAAAHHALGDPTRAYQHLLELKRLYPDQQVDPALFLPDFVALAQKAETEVQAERAAAAKVEPEPEPVAPAHEAPKVETETVETTPPKPPIDLTIRGGAVGFSDLSGQRAIGAAALVTASVGKVEGGVRALLGDFPAFTLEAAWRFADGGAQPRAGLRGTVMPFLTGGTGFGGGVFIGARIPVVANTSILADIGVDGLSVPDGYQPLAVMLSVGIDYAFLGGER